jgi:membrane-associated protease RseP (regulator of RpoE activity)
VQPGRGSRSGGGDAFLPLAAKDVIACDARVSSIAARGRRWLQRLVGIGLPVFVLFPWCYALVPPEVRFEHMFLFPFATSVEVLGLAYTATFFVILIHEGGHWIFGRLVGIRISDFVVGTGSPGLRFTCRGIRFSFGLWPRSGYVREIPARENLQFGKQFVFLAGGVVAECIFLSALFLAEPSPGLFAEPFGILRRFALVSGVVGLGASVWPRLVTIEGQVTPNDALLIRQAWDNRGQESEAWRQIELASEVNALSRAGKYAEAAAALERMLQSDPGNAERLAILAMLHAAAQNWDRALITHHEVIQRTEPNSLERVRAVDTAATLALQLGRRDELEKIRPLVEQVVQTAAAPTVIGTLGSILVELGETEAGVKLLNRCVAETDADHDRAIANAYLAIAAMRVGRTERAAELLGFAQGEGGDHPLVQRIVKELEPTFTRVQAPDRAQRGEGSGGE